MSCCLSICLSVYLSVCLSVFVCLSVCHHNDDLRAAADWWSCAHSWPWDWKFKWMNFESLCTGSSLECSNHTQLHTEHRILSQSGIKYNIAAINSFTLQTMMQSVILNKHLRWACLIFLHLYFHSIQLPDNLCIESLIKIVCLYPHFVRVNWIWMQILTG